MKRNAVAWAALIVSAAALVGSRFPARPLTAKQDIPEAGQATARELSRAFNAVAESIRPSVVQINVKKEISGAQMREGAPGQNNPNPGDLDQQQMQELLKKFFGGQIPEQGRGFRFDRNQFATGTGSGFVYDAKGHVLTNNHVVDGARDKDIVVSFADGSRAAAHVVGTYPDADVAVLKLEGSDFTPARIGTSKNLKVGDWVMAVGSPFGLSQTVTAGIVSATERDNLGINRFESFIQTDASINPGNSGGPLVGMDGKVIGINSAIATSSRANAGVGFAIPIDMAVRLADKLIEKGKITPLMMGVAVEPLSRGLAKSLGVDTHTSGVLVDEVVPGSPAEKAGLKQGDIITSFDGQPVHSREGLQYLVSTSESGKTYTVNYQRDGRPATLSVTPVDRQALLATVAPRAGTPEPENDKPAAEAADDTGFGLSVTPLTPTLAKRFGYDSQLTGLVVTKVQPGGPAQEAGIEVGDLITKVIKDTKIRPAGSVEEFEELVKRSVEVNVYREDVNHRLPGEFKTLTKTKAAAK